MTVNVLLLLALLTIAFAAVAALQRYVERSGVERIPGSAAAPMIRDVRITP
ncbi:hypothetical protein [Rhodococcus chondri]|uniref:Uncharacterized protein n=1 Tax=Rhodococcus chondri TaxID=3065941 RepID=A0ABU7JPJ9_9NOCA|nr:hypothetical protein [Rhodococcus sp. CC-R104]MEE2031961.1 hypothetical protein [Rhodococcus sp. CC-R104]